MKLLRGVHDFSALAAGSALTIGNFDGMHCGHQALLRALKTTAQRLNLPVMVVFFEPQPGEYFQQTTAPVRLMTRREKLQSLAQAGIDYVYCLPFNARLARMSAETFANRFIFTLFKAKYLLLGQDFRFGHARQGTADLLLKLAATYACEVAIMPDFLMGKVRVSSTLIRAALSNGEMEQARVWLGKPFALSGRVVYGAGRGREWGVPTANVQFGARRLPLHGVFCVQVECADKGCYVGVANVGYRPTLGGRALCLEVHLFDFEGSLYLERLSVLFLHRLRDEKKFATLEALIVQIQQDLQSARTYHARQAVN